MINIKNTKYTINCLQTNAGKTSQSRPGSGHAKNGAPAGDRSESRTSHTGSQAPTAAVDKTESSETPTKQRWMGRFIDNIFIW